MENFKKKKIDWFKMIFTENYLKSIKTKEETLKFIAVQLDALNSYLNWCISRDKFQYVKKLTELQNFVIEFIKTMKD